jgi:hypothetical protein
LFYSCFVVSSNINPANIHPDKSEDYAVGKKRPTKCHICLLPLWTLPPPNGMEEDENTMDTTLEEEFAAIDRHYEIGWIIAKS